MRCAKITWEGRRSRTYEARKLLWNTLPYIEGRGPDSAHVFWSKVWITSRPEPDRPLIEFDRLTDALAQRLAAISSDGKGWRFQIGARDGSPSWQGNINQDTAVEVLAAIERGWNAG